MSIGAGDFNIDIILSYLVLLFVFAGAGEKWAVLRRLAGSALFSPVVIARGGAGERAAQ